MEPNVIAIQNCLIGELTMAQRNRMDLAGVETFERERKARKQAMVQLFTIGYKPAMVAAIIQDAVDMVELEANAVN